MAFSIKIIIPKLNRSLIVQQNTSNNIRIYCLFLLAKKTITNTANFFFKKKFYRVTVLFIQSNRAVLFNLIETHFVLIKVCFCVTETLITYSFIQAHFALKKVTITFWVQCRDQSVNIEMHHPLNINKT